MTGKLATVAVTCVAAIMAGCTATVPGTASPAASSTPASANNGDPFSGMVACQVLDQLNAGQGYNPGDNISHRNECTATKPGLGSNGIALDPLQGLAEFKEVNPEATATTVNSRRALEVFHKVGGCAIAFEVGEHARVLINVAMAMPERNAEACPLAHDLASRAEPLLPKR